MRKKRASGFALIAATIITAMLLFLGTFFITTTTTDLHIGVTHRQSLQAYYLAEGAVANFISNLRIDGELFDRFIAGTLTQESSRYTHDSTYISGDFYEVYGISTGPALADLFARGTIPSDHTVIQRRVRLSIARATGSYPIWPYSLVAGGAGNPENGNLDVRSNVKAQGGIIHANRTLQIYPYASLAMTGGDVSATGHITVANRGTLTVLDGNQTEGVPMVSMPQINFDAGSNSWKSRANQIMTSDEFMAISSGGALSGIVFVDGSVADFKKTITMDGILIINGDFEIEPPGNLHITTNPIGSGLLVKDDLEISSTLTAFGAVYAGHWLEIEDEGTAFSVTATGGLTGFNVKIDASTGSPITIVYDQAAVSQPLDPAFNTSSPIIQINHWEEEY